MARATGIRRRHSKSCRSREGGRCNCNAGWEAWVYLARESKSVSRTFQREAEAKSWRADALSAARRGALRPARRDTRTLAAALREFVDGMKAGTVRPKNRGRYKPNTSRSYERALVNHIEPSALGRLKVADVRRADVQSLADELLASGLAPGTVSNVLNPIQALYRRLIDRDLIAHNPATRIDLPMQGRARPKRIASAAEAARLIAPVAPVREEEQPLWAAAFYAGLRRGKLQALRACDVDLGASLIHVEFGWDQEEGAIEPKSDASRRTIPVLAVLRDHLDEHLLRSGPHWGRAGVWPNRGGPVCALEPRQPRPGVLGGGGARANHAARGAAHLRLALDRLGCEREGGTGVHGAFEDPDDL